MLEGTPWFRVIPGAARWLCFKLVKLMATPSFDGAIPFSDPRQVSLLVSMEETEVETQLETLLEKGLLARNDAGALTCPAFGDVSARVRAARENGRKGGRPRKDAAPTPRTDPRQITQILPIDGGAAAKPSETQRWETPSAGLAARGSTTTHTLSKDSNSVVAREASGDWVQLAKDAIAEGDLQHRRLTFVEGKVWLAKGAEYGKGEAEVRSVVLGVVRQVMARPSTPPITGLGYFTPMIVRVFKGEEVLSDPSVDGEEERSLADFLRASEAWTAGGCKGPRPEFRAA